jgi:cytochrome c-type biogenesis protein CcmH/NrfG
MLAIRKTAVLLAPIFMLAVVLAQTSQDRIAPIATALGNREFDKALELLHPALQQSPGNAELWTMQGVAYAGRGQKKEALSSFRSALKISPDNILALQGAAQIEYEAGDAAGIPLLQHLLRLRPRDATTHAMLAVLEYQGGNCKAATCPRYLPGKAQAV